jgi:uncharacterized PurR-regulated membrane protein YhhQ (DUF165 family)
LKRSTAPSVGLLELVAVVVYLATIPGANWMIGNVGSVPFPGGPHTLPTGFGTSAPSGVYLIGLALVARDAVQLLLGRRAVIAAIVAGTLLSALVAPRLAVASAVAFAFGETADFLVYTPLARRRLTVAVLVSGAVGALVDSLLFLRIAFGDYAFWQGNTLGKLWMSVLALPFVYFVRRRAVPNASRG